METVAITPPTAVPHSVGILNPSSFSSTAGGSSNNDDQDENSFMSDVMCQFRQYIMQKEHAELTKKMEELAFQSKMSVVFSKYNRK